MRPIDADALYNGAMKDEYFKFKETDKSGREAFAYSCAMQRLVEAPTIELNKSRVITPEELHLQETVWFEEKPNHTIKQLTQDGIAALVFIGLLYNWNGYGTVWRCWTSRPTEEQRKAVKWNDNILPPNAEIYMNYLIYLFGDAKGVEINRFFFGRTEQYRQTLRGRRWSGMIDREKVIKALEYCTQHGSMCGRDCNGHWGWTDNSHTGMDLLDEYRTKCPYGNCETGCVKTLAKDSLTLLKAQEPRLLTFREWLEWKSTPPSQRDIIYCEYHDGTYAWIHPNDILQIHAMTDWSYGIVFRCWTAKTTKELSEAMKWDEPDYTY